MDLLKLIFILNLKISISFAQLRSKSGDSSPSLKISSQELENILNQLKSNGNPQPQPAPGSESFGSRILTPDESAASISIEVDGIDNNGFIHGTVTLTGGEGPTREATSTSAKALSQVLPASKTSLKSQANANLLLEATRLLLGQNKIPEASGVPAGGATNDRFTAVPEFELPNSRALSILPESNCIQEYVECDFNSKYRTYTGLCNNIFTPERGSASSPFRRVLNSAYDDGFNAPRSTSANQGRPLPNGRAVSQAVHASQRTPKDPNHTHMLMQWGQFLAHDMSLIPQATAATYGGVLDCGECQNDGNQGRRAFNSQPTSGDCYPISIDKNDPVFGRRGKRCMPFTRSLAGQLTIGPREQLNQISSFIDASNIYGSEGDVANNLRTMQNGRLKMQQGGFPPAKSCHKDTTDTVPFFRDDCPNCGIIVDAARPRNQNGNIQQDTCFKAGDSRNSENPALAGMHIIWVREHNRIADELKRMNPRWNDENVYQETRRIVGALNQMITYSEFLPVVYGSEMWNKSKLSQPHKGYLPCDPTISNEFATAAFRFGHSLINAPLELENGRSLNLHEHFFNGSFLHNSPKNLEQIMMGLSKQKSESMDRFLDSNIRNKLFGDLDLAALNIQRGRDHGLQPYVEYRKRFKMTIPESWRDLFNMDIMDDITVDRLSDIYESVEDIDLFTGLLSEKKMRDSLIGPLLGRMLSDQFGRLKDCDRYFYQNNREAAGFNQAQMDEFEKVTLAGILCNNMDRNAKMTIKCMQAESGRNPSINCAQHPKMNLAPWRDEQIYRKSANVRRRKIKPRCLPKESEFIAVDDFPPRPIGK